MTGKVTDAYPFYQKLNGGPGSGRHKEGDSNEEYTHGDTSLTHEDVHEIRKMNALVQIIKNHGEFAYGNETPEDMAIEWDDWDISPEKVDAWLSARCFEPETAHLLDDYNITPKQASKITEKGIGSYRDTIGYKVSNNDMSIDEAIEEIDA